ncbi:MAG TPA: glycolate oxidase subunit GlcE [Rhodocyclaceae bacterium]
MSEADLRHWQSLVRAAARANRKLRVRGFGSKDFYGGELEGEVFDTREHAGVVYYEPTELVVTARCGTPLAELEATLAGQGQWLPCEPPHFGGASVGGMVAAGIAGPARMAAGGIRDYVLGVRVIDGNGELLRFGGEVMKNVAGYDVSRLYAGSLGTLGVIVDVSLKVLPRPVATETRVLELDREAALATMNQFAGQAVPLTASAWYRGQLFLRFAGSPAAVGKLAKDVGGEVLADAAQFWESLREQTHEFFAGAVAGNESLYRLALPVRAASSVPAGDCLIEWGGAQRWCYGDGERLRETAEQSGGVAVRFRTAGDASRADSMPARHPNIQMIERRLRKAFDPSGVFSHGRLGVEH